MSFSQHVQYLINSHTYIGKEQSIYRILYPVRVLHMKPKMSRKVDTDLEPDNTE